MSRRSPHLEDGESIRMVFQRVCTAGGNVELSHGAQKGEFRLLVEEPARLVVQMSDVVRGQWGLKQGMHVNLKVTDRGRSFGSVVTLEGYGRFEGEEACHLSVPRQLQALETHRLTDYIPDKPFACAFTTLSNDAMKGLGVAFGEEGIELAPGDGGSSFGGKLRMNVGTMVELAPEAGLSWVLPGTVAYMGDGIVGVKWKPEADAAALKAYHAWLNEAARTQHAKDRNAFDARGSAAPKAASGTEVHRVTTRARIWSDKDPLVLVLAEGDVFPRRASEALGRRFGIASLDPLRGTIHPLLGELGAGLEDWGRVKLILIHHHLRSGSALEACRQLVNQEKCPLPILVGGTEEDAEVKRNRAIAAGAVDYLLLEPFSILKVIMTLDETLKLFG